MSEHYSQLPIPLIVVVNSFSMFYLTGHMALISKVRFSSTFVSFISSSCESNTPKTKVVPENCVLRHICAPPHCSLLFPLSCWARPATSLDNAGQASC